MKVEVGGNKFGFQNTNPKITEKKEREGIRRAREVVGGERRS
jgi:hypothetical protein